ncbi:hypothetical protein [Sneathiella sp.]|uniref:hypothetical protein n=1 Tax=Sneathiella sp. TaxID=1964365 RepID=UPI003564466F
MRKILFLPVVLTALLLAACSSDPQPPASKGQQLSDLQRAYQNRAITAEEYEEQKEKILDE